MLRNDDTGPRTIIPPSRQRIVLVTGMSGSGKSTALRALEDVDYFAIDNLPVDLLEKLVELGRFGGSPSRVAVVMDARDSRRLADLPRKLATLKGQEGVDVALVLLDADDDTLLRRYSETRRRHPLAPEGEVADGIARERERLTDVRRVADELIDTTGMTVHELRAHVQECFADPEAGRLNVTFLSFGYRYGLPVEADLVLDVRFLPNPHFVDALRDLRGTDPAVASYVLDRDESREFVARAMALLEFVVPRYLREGKAYLTVAVGCTGGKHRSVAVVRALAGELKEHGVVVKLRDRDVEKQ